MCVAPNFRPGNLIFNDTPSLSGTKSGIPDNIATAAYNEVLSRSLGTFYNIAVISRSFVIDEYGVHSTASIDGATHARHMKTSNTNKSKSPSRRSVTEKKNKNYEKPNVHTVADILIDSHTPKYTVDKIVRHVGPGDKIMSFDGMATSPNATKRQKRAAAHFQ